MSILLSRILSEANINGRNIQVYLDMDGVLVNMEKGFKKISGGVSTDDFAAKKFGGDQKRARSEFWKLINRNGTAFWSNLEPMPDAMVLWKFFSKYHPIILTAGQGPNIKQGKTEWCHRHLSADVNPILAQTGPKKIDYVTKDPDTTHVLIDDTERNIDAWNDPSQHRVAILHKSAGESIRRFTEMYIKQDKSQNQDQGDTEQK